MNEIEKQNIEILIYENLERGNKELYVKFIKNPASKSYHNQGERGLVKHTNKVVSIVCASNVFKIFLTFEECEIMIIAAILHDLSKAEEYDFVGGEGVSNLLFKDKYQHTRRTIELVLDFAEYMEGDKVKTKEIVNLIETHMGNIEGGALRQPETLMEELLHSADYFDAHTSVDRFKQRK